MKAGWEIKELGDVCLFENGDRGENYPSKSVQTSYGVPFINAGHLKDQVVDFSGMNYIPKERFDLLGNGKVKKNDILFCLRGSLGKFACVGDLEEAAIASSLVIIRPREVILNNFAMAYFQSYTCQNMIEKFKNGAAQPNLSAGSLKKFIIPVPPLPEQRRIVAILDEAFAGIAAAKEKAEQNLKNEKEVFTHYLKQVFNTKKNGWVENNIGEICLLKSGTTMPHDLEKETGDIPYLKVADMNFEENIGCITMSSRFLDKKDIKDSIIIPKGAVIFPKRGGAILTNKKRMTSIPICADLNIMAVIPTCKIESKLLYYYFLDVDMKKIGTGSSIPQINNYDISPLSIVYPRDLFKQKEIVSFLDEISEETGTLESIYQQKLSNLEELKKSLLQQAFSGAL